MADIPETAADGATPIFNHPEGLMVRAVDFNKAIAKLQACVDALEDVENARMFECNCQAGPGGKGCDGTCTYSNVQRALAMVNETDEAPPAAATLHCQQHGSTGKPNIIYDAAGRHVASVHVVGDAQATDTMALCLAAGPDLLKALKGTMRTMEMHHGSDCNCSECLNARAAITKAQGT